MFAASTQSGNDSDSTLGDDSPPIPAPRRSLPQGMWVVYYSISYPDYNTNIETGKTAKAEDVCLGYLPSAVLVVVQAQVLY